MNYLHRMFLCVAMCFTCTAQAELIQVGPGEQFETLSAVASSLNDGDVIEIVPGVYRDCAVITANNLTIRPKGWSKINERVRFQDLACMEQAIFVIYGNNIWIEGIDFVNARVPDGNGAGIKYQGAYLFLQDTYFLNNEMGILTGPNINSKVFINNSVFELNGKEAPRWGHGVYVGAIGSLSVTNSTFLLQKTGHHIKSRALYTEVVGNEIKDGESGTASYSIDVANGGSVLIENNKIQKGPNSNNFSAAICVACEGEINVGKSIVVRNNIFINASGQQVAFLNNLTSIEAQLEDNQLIGDPATLVVTLDNN